MTDVFTEHIKSRFNNVDIIVGLESRGFIIGPIVAQNLGVGFVPVRKAGKLPGETYQDKFELQKEALKSGQNVIIIDDLLATGGTLRAACQLVTKAKANVLECVVLIQLPDLKGRDNVPCQIKSFIDF
ncbi:hypothetical protein KUTeg_019062 [Tegillarca granosa]|uniref:adenine phosphoribosyltransferase n=1 Tax=Tegillarca granosa TaxID=220873 RepID=A0ABQ9EFP4_TEGGR|nr:hypothetical protein KUTeg_019062 [Tegillarca granosa]